jgi:hypothetical protein
MARTEEEQGIYDEILRNSPKYFEGMSEEQVRVDVGLRALERKLFSSAARDISYYFSQRRLRKPKENAG